MRSFTLLALFLACTFFQESAMPADQAPADVPHPKLPAGAGMIDADAPKTFTTTASGLQYRVLRKGKGATPKASDTVKVNYHGWLDNGTTSRSTE